MPFKIIQTIENNKVVLTIVPSKWEQGGTLFWPSHRNEVKLIHEENSIPRTDWKKLHCIKKREFSTLPEAEKELKIMELASDTDEENKISLQCTSRQKTRPLHSTRVLQPLDLNDQIILYQNTEDFSGENYVQVENNDDPMVITLRTDAEQVLPSISTHETVAIANNNSPVVTNLDTRYDSKSSSNPSEPNSVTYVNVTQNQLLTQVLENQEKIMSQLAVLQASVDFLMGANARKKPAEQPSNRMPIQPLNSKDDFDVLETSLKDEIFYNKLVTELTFICGNSGKCNGVDSCYKLVDYFFTRQILLQCNWTGSTRGNSEKKIPFKYYSRIRNCFFDIVRKSDNNFTENDADKFFKVIIKNAKARLQNKINSVTRKSKLRVRKEIVNDRNMEKLLENGESYNESPPPQQASNDEVNNISLEDDNNVVNNLNDQENERECTE